MQISRGLDSVCFLLDWLQYQDQKVQTAQLFACSRTYDSYIYTFHEELSIKGECKLHNQGFEHESLDELREISVA